MEGFVLLGVMGIGFALFVVGYLINFIEEATPEDLQKAMILLPRNREAYLDQRREATEKV